MTQSVALLWTWRYWMYCRSLAELDGLSLTPRGVAQSSPLMISSPTTFPYSPISTTLRATSYHVLSTTLMLRYCTIFCAYVTLKNCIVLTKKSSKMNLDFLDNIIFYVRGDSKILILTTRITLVCKLTKSSCSLEELYFSDKIK